MQGSEAIENDMKAKKLSKVLHRVKLTYSDAALDMGREQADSLWNCSRERRLEGVGLQATQDVTHNGDSAKNEMCSPNFICFQMRSFTEVC